MTPRDRLFRIICDVKYTAIYGRLYSRRIERLNILATAFLAFAFSGTFCTFWIWQGHAKMLAGVMLVVSLLQMLYTRRGYDKQAMRMSIACGLLESLYRDAMKLWQEAEAREDDSGYVGAAAELKAREAEITAIADNDVKNNEKDVAEATDLMNSQVKYDFNL